MCDKAVDSCPFVFDSIPDWCTTQKICDKAFSEDSFMLKYCLDRYKTQEICDKAVDNFLQALKLVTDWFVTRKIIKKLADDNILFLDENSGNVTFSSDKVGIVSVNLNIINTYDTNFYKYDLKIIIYARLWFGIININHMNYIFLYIYLYIFINRVNYNCELYTYMEYSDIFEHKFIHEARYSSKIFTNFVNFSCLIFFLIPRIHILLMS